MNGHLQTGNAVTRRDEYHKLSQQLLIPGPRDMYNAARVLSALSEAQAQGMEIEWLAAFLTEFGGRNRARSGQLTNRSIFAANREWDL